jgi:cystathionine beta-synthase
MALVAALQVAAGIDDPDALVVVVLPDGGRSYLSKIFNDAWMTHYGFLERASTQTVGDIVRYKQDRDDTLRLVTVSTQDKVRDAMALMHEHGVSQLPVVSAHDALTVVGSIDERGLLKRIVDDAGLLGEPIVDVMEAPFPAVAAGDAMREAVELLAAERQALLVTVDGRPAGILTRSDLLEALAR